MFVGAHELTCAVLSKDIAEIKAGKFYIAFFKSRVMIMVKYSMEIITIFGI